MEEKKYLKWYNKIGYGSGDIAGNVVYAFLTSFVMVYLTDTIGLASGIVGTLIAVSKLNNSQQLSDFKTNYQSQAAASLHRYDCGWSWCCGRYGRCKLF